jgi:hypothetical protein
MKTLKEVLDKIVSEMPLPDKMYIRGTKEKDLIQFHSNIGRQIRNTFNLWQGNPELLKDMGLPEDKHPDDVSQKIIEALWKRLQNEP